MSNRIDVGDKVRVCWTGKSWIDGVVLHMPQAAGELWIIETDSAIHYVQTFETIWKEKPNVALTGERSEAE